MYVSRGGGCASNSCISQYWAPPAVASQMQYFLMHHGKKSTFKTRVIWIYGSTCHCSICQYKAEFILRRKCFLSLCRMRISLFCMCINSLWGQKMKTRMRESDEKTLALLVWIKLNSVHANFTFLYAHFSLWGLKNENAHARKRWKNACVVSMN